MKFNAKKLYVSFNEENKSAYILQNDGFGIKKWQNVEFGEHLVSRILAQVDNNGNIFPPFSEHSIAEYNTLAEVIGEFKDWFSV